MRRSLPLLIMGISLAFCTTVQAAAMNNLVLGSVNELEDQDFETIISANPGLVEVGDLIAGVVKIQKTQAVFPTATTEIDLQTAADTFTAIFLIKTITAGDGIANNSVDTLTFGTATQAEWDSVFGTGGPVNLGMGASPLSISTGTMALAYDGVPYSTATDITATTGASAATFISGGRLLWEFGFTGAGGTAAAGEFWSTFGIDPDDVSLLSTNNPTNRFALGVTQYHAGVELVPHNYLGALQNPPQDAFFTSPTAIQAKGNFQSTAAGSAWPIGTDTNFYIAPVPEPTSIILFAVGAAAMCGFGLRRRNRQDVSV